MLQGGAFYLAPPDHSTDLLPALTQDWPIIDAAWATGSFCLVAGGDESAQEIGLQQVRAGHRQI